MYFTAERNDGDLYIVRAVVIAIILFVVSACLAVNWREYQTMKNTYDKNRKLGGWRERGRERERERERERGREKEREREREREREKREKIISVEAWEAMARCGATTGVGKRKLSTSRESGSKEKETKKLSKVRREKERAREREGGREGE